MRLILLLVRLLMADADERRRILKWRIGVPLAVGVPIGLFAALHNRGQQSGAGAEVGPGIGEPPAAVGFVRPPEPAGGGGPRRTASGLEIQQVPYAQARKGFATRLLQHGPSPDEWDPFPTPAGAVEMRYQSGGNSLLAYVTPPPADGQRRPAVLFLHGGFAYGDEDWSAMQPYRDAGFVVMTPLLRGENGQPGDFTLFYDEVDDALAAAEALAQLPYVDAGQIFVAGHSAGGTLAMLVAQASPRFRAAASFSGSPDQILFTRAQRDLVRFDTSNPREYILRSPLAFATSFQCPARLYFGIDEPAFHPPTQQTAELARRQGLNVEAVAVAGNHFTAVPGAMAQSIAFFRQIAASSPAPPPPAAPGTAAEEELEVATIEPDEATPPPAQPAPGAVAEVVPPAGGPAPGPNPTPAPEGPAQAYATPVAPAPPASTSPEAVVPPPRAPSDDAHAAQLNRDLADLRSTDPSRRHSAADRLSRDEPDASRRAEVARALEPLLRDRSSFVRQAGLKALGVWGSRPNVPAILAVLDDPSPLVRYEALTTLGKLKDPRAADAVAQRLAEEGTKAAEVLRALGAGAEPAVLRLLASPDPGVRLTACKLLKEIGTQRSVRSLRALLRDPSRLLANEARDALEAIKERTGKKPARED